MSHRAVFDAFATGRPSSGGSVHTTRIPSSGAIALYSYTTPIAYRCDHGGGVGADTPAIFDGREHSITTSEQQNQAKSACEDHGVRVEDVEHADFQAACRYCGIDTTEQSVSRATR